MQSDLILVIVAKDLFNKDKPLQAIGFVSLQGQLLQVIGISQSTNSSPLAGLIPNKKVYIPTATFSDLYPGKPIYTMDIRTQKGHNKKAISARVITVLKAKYHSNVFADASSCITRVTNMIGRVITTITVNISAHRHHLRIVSSQPRLALPIESLQYE